MKKNTLTKITSLALITTLTLQPLPIFAYSKTESIYSNLNANGTIQKTTVNSHLSKLEKEAVEDETILKGIMNLNGEEKYKQEENKLIWKSTGKDIFYEGTTDQEQPLDIHIKYFLNGKEMTPKKMKNKKGQVSIKISIENKAYKSTQNLHVPFVVTTGMLLDSTKNSDISITNGEVVETGSRSMVLALAAPGLYEDLKIKELSSLDEITINYTTTKFSLSNIYLVATPKLLEKADLNIFEKANLLSNSMNTLESSMNEIDKGAKTLKEASETIATGSKEISSNLEKALVVINQIKDGSINLDSGLKEVITTLDQIKLQLESSNTSESMNNIKKLIGVNQTAVTQLTTTNNSLEPTYTGYNLASFQSDSELTAYFASIGVDEATITNLLTCKKTYEGNLSLIKLLQTNTEAFTTMLQELEKTSSMVTTLINELNNALVKLEAGSNQIANALQEVSIGLDKLSAGTNTLASGTKELSNGANTLSSGIATINKEGISKLTETSKKVTNYSTKTKQLVKLSKDYQGFASNNSNKTIFIYKVNSK